MFKIFCRQSNIHMEPICSASLKNITISEKSVQNQCDGGESYEEHQHLFLTKDFHLLKMWNDKKLGENHCFWITVRFSFLFQPARDHSQLHAVFFWACSVMGTWKPLQCTLCCFSWVLGDIWELNMFLRSKSDFMRSEQKKKENASGVDDDYIFEREVPVFGVRLFHLSQISSNTKLLPCIYLNKQTKKERWKDEDRKRKENRNRI